jgi:hypothetical protein
VAQYGNINITNRSVVSNHFNSLTGIRRREERVIGSDVIGNGAEVIQRAVVDNITIVNKNTSRTNRRILQLAGILPSAPRTAESASTSARSDLGSWSSDLAGSATFHLSSNVLTFRIQVPTPDDLLYLANTYAASLKSDTNFKLEYNIDTPTDNSAIPVIVRLHVDEIKKGGYTVAMRNPNQDSRIWAISFSEENSVLEIVFKFNVAPSSDQFLLFRDTLLG